jgi:hypothetical protein
VPVGEHHQSAGEAAAAGEKRIGAATAAAARGQGREELADNLFASGVGMIDEAPLDLRVGYGKLPNVANEVKVKPRSLVV